MRQPGPVTRVVLSRQYWDNIETIVAIVPNYCTILLAVLASDNEGLLAMANRGWVPVGLLVSLIQWLLGTHLITGL
jgi:hypothetical protein